MPAIPLCSSLRWTAHSCGSGAETAADKMAYTAVNCVAAGLVRTPGRWPGAKVLVDEVGRRVVKVKRPDWYFDASNPDWPDEVSIPIVMPACLQEACGSDDACRAVIQRRVDERIRQAHRDNSRRGQGYLGAKRVMKTPHTKRAGSNETFGSLVPSFATGGHVEVARRMKEQRERFLSAYRAAWHAWKAGLRNVLFPAGTWKMRVSYAACCLPFP